MKHSFPPVMDARTRLVILGSLPGEASLAKGQYYAHPRNQFWRLIGAVIGADLANLAYDDRLTALLDAHVGLWDVVAMAKRAGSLDAAIRDHQPNDLERLCADLSELKAIAFNGGTAARIGRRELADIGLPLIALPSSSPAHARLSFQRKLETWMKLRAYL